MKNYTKRIIGVAILYIMCIVLSGCSAVKQELIGVDKIEDFRKEASDYQSARYFITNTIDDTLDEVFTFYYKEDGTMVYLLEKNHDGVYSAEYNDGENIYTQNGDEKSVIHNDDPEFVLYNKDNKHPYANSQLLFYVNGYIDSAVETIDAEINVIYEYIYDVEKMNKELDKNLTEFKTSYAFNKNGDFLYFTEHNSSVNDGEVFEYDYMIEIAEVNNITEIENPVE